MLGLNEEIFLEALSKKFVTLLALVTGHRTLSLIKIKNIERFEEFMEIKIPDTKTSRINRKQPLLILPVYEKDTNICVATLESYLTRTQTFRGSERSLFIACKKPCKIVTTQTPSRWIKEMLSETKY